MVGQQLITIGIDEVGRGPLAGPLCVAAVALDMNQSYEGLADSKKLTPRKRERESVYIKQQALGIGIGWVDARDLDQLGMVAALKLAARRAYDQLPLDIQSRAQQIIIDGDIAMLNDPRVITVIKGDDKVQAVSAASIVAKVARDSYMKRLGRLFPGYGLEKHMGYGTAAHMAALRELGPVAGVHRASFRPVGELMGRSPKPKFHYSVDETDGRLAEAAAADYLAGRGYEIIERNWKTKVCEIDIIATKDDRIYFAEVKYRENDQHGDGMAAITPKKLAQMKLGAEMYLHYYPKMAASYQPQLMAISLHDRPPMVDAAVMID